MTARIDAHVHLWSRALDPQHWIDPMTMAVINRDFGPTDLTEMLGRTGLDQAIVVQSSNSLEESIRLAQLDTAVVAGLVAWVDLTDDVSAQLERVRGAARITVVGVRHLVHIDPDPEWLGRDDVGRGLRALQRAGLCFDLVVRDWQLPQATEVVCRHDGLQFVLDHLGGPPAPGSDLAAWASNIRDLARCPNVVAKISGLSSGLAPGSWGSGDLRPIVETALDVFGPRRLLYGSDWPLAELGGGAATWKDALEVLLTGQSADDLDRIFGGTAVEVYSLP